MSNASAVESLLFAALEKPSAAERAAFLDSACGGDTELRRQVEKLLKAEARVGDFLQKPVCRAVGRGVQQPPHGSNRDHRPRPRRLGQHRWVAPRCRRAGERPPGGARLPGAARDRPRRHGPRPRRLRPQPRPRRRPEDPAARGQRRPLRPRVEDHRPAAASGHPAGPRPGHAGRRLPLPGHEAHRRANPGRRDEDRRPAAAAAGVHAGLPGGRLRPQPGRHPPRPEAGQRHGRRLRRGAGHGLGPGQGLDQPRSRGRAPFVGGADGSHRRHGREPDHRPPSPANRPTTRRRRGR